MLVPRATNTLPVNHCWNCEKRGRVCSQSPKEPDNKATVVFTIVPVVLNKAPKKAICKATEPCEGLANCGKKAMKKIATFGLRILVAIACEKIRLRLAFASVAKD